MAFTRGAYDPTDGISNQTSYPSAPGSEAAFRKQFQDNYDQAMAALNALMTALENTDSGTSGAENIGSYTISGVTGTTVRAQIANLKTQLDAVVAGGLTEGIINDSGYFDAGVVNNAAMAANSVDSDQYVDGSIDSAHLSTDVINSGTLIADDVIDSEHIAAGAIDAEHLATNSVTSGKIAAEAVTAAAVAPGHVVGAKFSISGSQSISDSTETGVNWTVWDYDPDTSKSGTYATRMICKYAGYYTISSAITFSAPTGDKNYGLYIKKNGTVIARSRQVPGTGSLYLVLTATADLISLAVNDYIEVYVYQNSGSSRDITGIYTSSYLTMRRNVF